jgi:hypothetical protein
MTALSIGKGVMLDSAEELEAALRQIGAARYHNLHPFHRLLHGGKLNKGQVQAWALNRYYYQSTIPIKDAVVISRFRDRTTRMEWRHRIEDHDGEVGSEGGIERWLKLTEGLGLDTAYVESTEGILPATRFAVEAYVHFVRDRSPLEAIASSLTELFASAIGDCALFESRRFGGSLRLESVQNATDHARCVAARLTGDAKPYDGLPWFWSDQGPDKLQMVGLTTGYDRVAVRGDRSAGAFSAFCYKSGQLVGIESVNRAGDHMFGRRLLAAHGSITPEQAADSGFDLKSALT